MKITVQLGQRSYPIYIGTANFADKSLLAGIIANKKVGIVTNTTVSQLYLQPLLNALEHTPEMLVELPDGEQFKNMHSIEAIFDAALSAKLNRSSVLIALGGGVIGDMTGFAAACYQRGIDFIQIPTTLLSQVDSSVGGKTGINHPLGKNMIGAFHQPKAVIIDIETLQTLPTRELAAGLAEVIKYGLIYDVQFFEWLENNIEQLNNKNSEALTYAIAKSCEIKAAVVAEDEFETTGRRAILNLGHTFGHAIETHQGYGEWLHGEAVAVGMIMAADLSCRMNWISEAIYLRIKALVLAAKLPIVAPNEMTVSAFLEVMAIDKKNIEGKIRLVLLSALGEAIITQDVAPELIQSVIIDNIAQ